MEFQVDNALISGALAIFICLLLMRKRFAWYHYLIAFTIGILANFILQLIRITILYLLKN